MEPLAAAVAAAGKIAYPLAELNGLQSAAPPDEFARLPRPGISDTCRLNYVTAMVEMAAHRAGVVPPLRTSDVPQRAARPLSTLRSV